MRPSGVGISFIQVLEDSYEVMNVMFARLWDLGDDTSDKLEDIEGLSIGIVEQTQLGIVV